MMQSPRVAVIGLGVYGLSIVEALSRSGIEVLGFDQFAPGHSNGSSHGETRIFRLWPGEGASFSKLASQAASHWQRLASVADEQTLTMSGALIAGPIQSDFVRESQRLALEGGASPNETELSSEYCRQSLGVALPSGWVGCLHRSAGVIHVASVYRALQKSISRRGGKLIVGAPASIGSKNGQVLCERQEFKVDRIIIAAGAWASEFSKSVGALLKIEQKTLGWYPLKTNVDARAISLGAICLDDQYGLFAVREGNYLKIGLDSAGASLNRPGDIDRLAMKTDLKRLEHSVRRFFPNYDPAAVEKARCLYTSTRDLNFLVSPMEARQDVLMVSCCSGHGFKYAPAIASHIVSWAIGDPTPELDIFSRTNKRVSANPVGQRS